MNNDQDNSISTTASELVNNEIIDPSTTASITLVSNNTKEDTATDTIKTTENEHKSIQCQDNRNSTRQQKQQQQQQSVRFAPAEKYKIHLIPKEEDRNGNIGIPEDGILNQLMELRDTKLINKKVSKGISAESTIKHRTRRHRRRRSTSATTTTSALPVRTRKALKVVETFWEYSCLFRPHDHPKQFNVALNEIKKVVHNTNGQLELNCEPDRRKKIQDALQDMLILNQPFTNNDSSNDSNKAAGISSTTTSTKEQQKRETQDNGIQEGQIVTRRKKRESLHPQSQQQEQETNHDDINANNMRIVVCRRRSPRIANKTKKRRMTL